MDFSLSDEQVQLRELARKILSDLATNERLKDIEASAPVFDEDLWQELGRSNLPRVVRAVVTLLFRPLSLRRRQ